VLGPSTDVCLVIEVTALCQPGQIVRLPTFTTTTLSMESLNLNALAGSLPTSNLANAEKELLNNFRGTYSLFLS